MVCLNSFPWYSILVVNKLCLQICTMTKSFSVGSDIEETKKNQPKICFVTTSFFEVKLFPYLPHLTLNTKNSASHERNMVISSFLGLTLKVSHRLNQQKLAETLCLREFVWYDIVCMPPFAFHIIIAGTTDHLSMAYRLFRYECYVLCWWRVC